ncbi:MAG: hypothetical protein R3F20_12395 [Planctomycetota bacterium]
MRAMPSGAPIVKGELGVAEDHELLLELRHLRPGLDVAGDLGAPVGDRLVPQPREGAVLGEGRAEDLVHELRERDVGEAGAAVRHVSTATSRRREATLRTKSVSARASPLLQDFSKSARTRPALELFRRRGTAASKEGSRTRSTSSRVAGSCPAATRRVRAAKVE